MDGYKCKICSATGKLKRCKGCVAVRYCGEECQKKHWPEHKAFCKKEGPGSVICYRLHKRLRKSYTRGLIVSLLALIEKHACHSCVGIIMCATVSQDINVQGNENTEYVFCPMLPREAFLTLVRANPKKVSNRFLNVRDFPVYIHKYIQKSKNKDGEEMYTCKAGREVFLNLENLDVGNRHNRRVEISRHYNICIAAFENSKIILEVKNDKVEYIPADIRNMFTKWFELDEGESIVRRD